LEEEKPGVAGRAIVMRAHICFVGLLVMMLVSVGCGDETATEPGDRKAPDTTAVFPLGIGNKWIYDDPSQSDSITASVVQDGKRYYVLEGFFGQPISVRMNDQQQLVVRRDHESCDEYVLFDFGLEPGDRWAFGSPCSDTLQSDVMIFHSRVDSVTVPAGTYRDCYEFVWDPSITDSGASWTIAPGVGVVSFVRITLAGSRSYALVEFVEGEE
jgi:hypothetical protein